MAGANIICSPNRIAAGGVITVTADSEAPRGPAVVRREFEWWVDGGKIETTDVPGTALWDTSNLRSGDHRVRVIIRDFGPNAQLLSELDGSEHVLVDPAPAAVSGSAPQPASASRSGAGTTVQATEVAERRAPPAGAWGAIPPPSGMERMQGPGNGHPPDGPHDTLPVTLERSLHPATPDQILWTVIRTNAKRLSFDNYSRIVNAVIRKVGTSHAEDDAATLETLASPKKDIDPHELIHTLRRLAVYYDPYSLLRTVTQAFVMVECHVHRFQDLKLQTVDLDEELARRGLDGNTKGYEKKLERAWSEDGGYLKQGMLPYLALIQSRLPSLPIDVDQTDGIRTQIHEKLEYPCFLELIWSYWHEEGGLVQTINHISERFQNVRPPDGADPLVGLKIDPLRPLNEMLWGYIQDELGHTSVIRRAHEYANQYGFTLEGKALAGMRLADRRSKFLESFHNLLNRCVRFFGQDDNTTVVADGFPLLNAIKETHYVLAQGAENQFGGLASTVRQEMLLQQWILARPEMHEFLGGPVMVPYPEDWMDRVDAMKKLQGWTDVSIVHFNDLAVFGEQLLLSIRYGMWSKSNDGNQAANWARYWRQEIQGYIHAYRAVTGVDLTSELTDPQQLAQRYMPPSRLLHAREAMQRRRRP